MIIFYIKYHNIVDEISLLKYHLINKWWYSTFEKMIFQLLAYDIFVWSLLQKKILFTQKKLSKNNNI